VLHFKCNFISIIIAVSKENDIFQIAKKTIRDGRLALPDLIKKVPSEPGKISRSGMRARRGF
jgi:hypothetical protein